MGTHDVKDKTIQWESTAIFRFEHGRIAEEWVSRDELGMLLDAGVLRRGRRPIASRLPWRRASTPGTPNDSPR